KRLRLRERRLIMIDDSKKLPATPQTANTDIVVVNNGPPDLGASGPADVLVEPSDREFLPTRPADNTNFENNDPLQPVESGRANVATQTAEMQILPGEDPGEFQRLHQALIEEWNPLGPIEDDAVLTLAIDLWRKRRFRRWQQRRAAFDAHHQRRSELEYLEKQPAPFPTKITDPAP